MKVYIILNDPYPNGMANANRIHLYARGLQEQGTEVKIIIPKPKLSKSNANVSYEGVHDSVPYLYPSKTAYRSNSFLKRRVYSIMGPIKSAIVCLKEKPDAVMVVSENLYYTLIFKMVALLLRKPLILEKSEVPYMHHDDIGIFKRLYLKLSLSLYDGIVVITNNLKDYLLNTLGIKSKTVLVPILIDERKVNSNKAERKDYILYSGSLYERKDGILTILKSFAKVVKELPDFKMYITGNAKSSVDYDKVMKIIEDNNMQSNIVFTGFVSQEELFDLMRNARLLVLAKPHNRQNDYNFPTKLGEYLISGTPVLCTLNDNLREYFTTDKNIYATELNCDDMSKKAIEVLTNKEKAEAVGQEGQKVALESFSSIKQVEKINLFIREQV